MKISKVFVPALALSLLFTNAISAKAATPTKPAMPQGTVEDYETDKWTNNRKTVLTFYSRVNNNGNSIYLLDSSVTAYTGYVTDPRGHIWTQRDVEFEGTWRLSSENDRYYEIHSY